MKVHLNKSLNKLTSRINVHLLGFLDIDGCWKLKENLAQ